ncbi:Serine/threonine-protein kinase PknK [compost metagenome]
MEGFLRSSNGPEQGVVPPVRPGKFLVPATLPGLLDRSALLPLGEQHPGLRLLLISACAGAGKTTLLAHYQAHCLEQGRRVLWCNLDPADNDPRHLAATLFSGLSERGIISADVPALGQLPQWLLEQLAGCPEAFAILFDEFDVITHPDALAFIQQLLKVLPTHATLGLASRTLPELNLGRLRALGQLHEVSSEDLRLSLEETSHYLRQCHQLALAQDDIARLYQRTEGWLTGLYLATLSLKRHEDPSAFINAFSGATPALSEYLGEDVLARLDEPSQRFVLQTCVLAQFCPALCDAVTGRTDSAAMIQALEQDNLFITATDEQHLQFRYHGLFADFLRHTLARRHPDWVAQLNRAAAQWYTAADHSEEALEHLFAANAIDEAASQLVSQVDHLVENGHASLMMRWLSRIPESVREQHPGLGVAYAWALIHARRYKEALQVMESPTLVDQQHHIRCLLLVINDRVTEARQSAEQLLPRLPCDSKSPYRVTAYVLASTLYYSGRYDEARQLLGSDRLREAQSESPYLRDVTDSLEALLDITQGQLDSGMSRLLAANRRSRETLAGTPPVGFPVLQTALCLVMYETDALEQAHHRLNELLPYAREHAAPDSLITTHVLLARITYLNGDRQGWMRYLAELDQLGRVSGSSRILCSSWLERARVATLENRLDTADHAMRSAEQHSDWDQPGILITANDVDTPYIARQRLNIAQGTVDPDDLLQAMNQALTRHQHRRALKLRLLLAMALEACKQPKQALEQLTQALGIASPVGFIRTFLDEGAPLAALLERWSVTFHGQESALGIEPRFVAHLLQRCHTGPAQEAKAQESSPNALSNRELQVLRLLALGYRNREIAEKMFLSELTVKSHLRKINTKLGAGGRTEAVSIARIQGLLD